MKTKLHLSIRTLVEQFHRSGDLALSNRYGFVDPLEGIRIHQTLQGNRGSNYKKEVGINYF